MVSWMGFDEWREGEAQKAQAGTGNRRKHMVDFEWISTEKHGENMVVSHDLTMKTWGKHGDLW